MRLAHTFYKNLPAMQETWVRSLGRKEPLEKGMATHSSNLAQRMLWTEEPGILRAEIPQKKWSSHHGQQKSPKCSTWMQSQNDRMIALHFQGKPFSITVIQVYSPTSNATEADTGEPGGLQCMGSQRDRHD